MKESRTPRRLRCAIYTRKSSEEGLDQDFNSLDAQREACAAYIASQAGEGWRLVPDRFDDGGYSGGNIERPALRRLLDAIDRSAIDIVVVYKVDRLTRSLTDFARIVERFDAKGASFVSVTQSFNTTTSMGRLTLNVLLSFAQFEREVTGERIRDKISASKAKGMWMGGRPPLGYDPVGRTLQINASEADVVRQVFARYLELGSVHDLAADLAARGIRSKTWTTRDGRVIESAPFARGALYYLLRNRLYRGEIVHKGVVHAGLHPPILDAGTFAAVQASLDAKVGTRRERPTRPGGSPLTGLLFDSAGNRMSPVSARGKSGKPHRYYVSKAVLTGRSGEAGSVTRVPAGILEDLVRDRLARILPDGASWDWNEARRMLVRVVVADAHIEIVLSNLEDASTETAMRRRLPKDDRLIVDGDQVRLLVSARLEAGQGVTVLLDANGRLAVDRMTPDLTLLRAIARARTWRERLTTGAVANLEAIAKEEGCTAGPIRHLLPLAYMSPEVTRAVLAGHQRPDLNLERLVRAGLPLSWRAQRRLFGLDPAR